MSQADQTTTENTEPVVSEDTQVEEVTAEEVAALEAEKAKGVELPDFRTGDTVRVLYKIIEGDKTRFQPFEGIVIARKGSGVSKTFTIRRIGADNVGVERIFPLYSPNITKLEVKKLGKVRKAKLYYLRDKIGRAAIRIKERKADSTAK